MPEISIMARGRLIVFEGIDGAGTETQSKLLLEHLKSGGTPAERIRYPGYEHPIGKLIGEYLHGKFDLPVESQVLVHAADRAKDKAMIKKWLDEGRIVIADRYITSTMAYQGSSGFPVDKIISLADTVGLPRPDMVIYLRISAATSARRKAEESAELDRNESDSCLLGRVSKLYEKLARDNAFGKWVVIDGEQPKEKVFREVRKALKL